MPNISPQKILVLGGSGFVGRHVCEALSRQGHRITVPTRRLPARSVQMFPGVEVVRAVVHCLSHRTTVGETFELCGPEIFTLQQLVEIAGRWSGHPRFVLPLPASIAYLQALMMEFLPGPTLMSRDNLASMQTDNVASKSLQDLLELGIQQPQSLQAVFPSLKH